MAMVNCANCGQLYQMKLSKICLECAEKRKVYVETVKHYIASHPNCSLMELHRDTGVSLKTLNQLIEEGMITRLTPDV